MGLALRTKPSVPTIIKIVQEITVGGDRKIKGVNKLIIDKNSEDYLEYQVELKQYIT